MITPIYASIIGLLFVVLSVRTLRLRRRLEIAVGHGDDPAMLRAMRAHANFAEYVPITLLLVFFLEMQSKSSWWIHATGGMLIVGRTIHAYGLSQVDEPRRLRVAGMALTFTPLIASASAILVLTAL